MWYENSTTILFFPMKIVHFGNDLKMDKQFDELLSTGLKIE